MKYLRIRTCWKSRLRSLKKSSETNCMPMIITCVMLSFHPEYLSILTFCHFNSGILCARIRLPASRNVIQQTHPQLHPCHHHQFFQHGPPPEGRSSHVLDLSPAYLRRRIAREHPPSPTLHNHGVLRAADSARCPVRSRPRLINLNHKNKVHPPETRMDTSTALFCLQRAMIWRHSKKLLLPTASPPKTSRTNLRIWMKTEGTC
jgi:hypothetical protein